MASGLQQQRHDHFSVLFQGSAGGEGTVCKYRQGLSWDEFRTQICDVWGPARFNYECRGMALPVNSNATFAQFFERCTRGEVDSTVTEGGNSITGRTYPVLRCVLLGGTNNTQENNNNGTQNKIEQKNENNNNNNAFGYLSNQNNEFGIPVASNSKSSSAAVLKPQKPVSTSKNSSWSADADFENNNNNYNNNLPRNISPRPQPQPQQNQQLVSSIKPLRENVFPKNSNDHTNTTISRVFDDDRSYSSQPKLSSSSSSGFKTTNTANNHQQQQTRQNKTIQRDDNDDDDEQEKQDELDTTQPGVEGGGGSNNYSTNNNKDNATTTSKTQIKNPFKREPEEPVHTDSVVMAIRTEVPPICTNIRVDQGGLIGNLRLHIMDMARKHAKAELPHNFILSFTRPDCETNIDIEDDGDFNFLKASIKKHGPEAIVLFADVAKNSEDRVTVNAERTATMHKSQKLGTNTRDNVTSPLKRNPFAKNPNRSPGRDPMGDAARHLI